MDLQRLYPATWLRNAMGASGVYLLSGAGAVTFWRSTDASPGAGDLMIWLLGVPTMLLLATAGFWRWRAARRARETDVATPAATDVEPSNAGPAIVATHVARSAPLDILASALWLPTGRDALDVIDTLRRQQRPGLHPSLRDLHGFPVTAAGVDDVDEADGEWGLDPAEDADDSLRRAIALLRPVAEDLLVAALPDTATDAIDASGDAWNAERQTMHPYAMHHSQSARAPTTEQRSTLRIALLVPARWPEPIRAMAVTALGELAGSLGHDRAALETFAHPVHREADALHVLERLAAALHDSPVRDDRALVLATDSWLTEATVEQLHADERLLRSGSAEGEVPGEGAAGLLLAAARSTGSRTSAVDQDPADATVRLHLPQQTRLADACRPRDAARITAELIARALDTAGCTADAPLQVVTGADHRPSRMVEAATALVAQRPELDPVADALHLGVACGSLGVAGPLALLAVAAAHARETGTPTLALALADARTRAAAVLMPATHESLSPAAASAAA